VSAPLPVAQHDAAALRERIAGRRVVASISGGKDSTSMSLYLTELGIDHDRVFADTGWESDITLDYVRTVLPGALGPITWVRSSLQMVDLIRDKGMFPSQTIRYCTQMLKVFAIRDYMRGLGDVALVNAVGIRRAESEKRAESPEWEPWPPGMSGLDVDVWRPLVEWTLDDVVAIHHRHGVKPNPLYLLGASRVGCWPCIFSRKEEIALVAELDPARIDMIRALEVEVGAAAEARQVAKGTTLEAQGYGRPVFFQLHRRDADGNETHACVPIDEVVEWSRTTRGGKQLALFQPPLAREGCMRWGMCEAPS
jgi:3'-phosphoadenosine 5'-phosphosulfate sulfotransferase (PAPS reductase)/FAD synthetase